LAWKHNVTTEEVEGVFKRMPHYRFIENGNIEGENLYAALGRTEAGRFIIVFFIHKTTEEALIISARDMTRKERKIHARK
jgi:uncharacterized DUF497 family protein